MRHKFLKSLSLVTLLLAGCGNLSARTTQEFSDHDPIHAITRENGSGTRTAFMELFGLDEINPNIMVTNATSVVMTSVAQDVDAIGYSSLGSLNDEVKALKIDGVDASTETIKSGQYTMARPFNIAYKEKDLSKLGQAYIDFLQSSQAAKIIEENGYVANGTGKDYFPSKLSGKLMISGSSSVAPIMEKLKEEFEKLEPDTQVIVQQSDSSSGMNDVIDGTSDIGIASRELKESELEKGLTAFAFAKDGIVMIVNMQNPNDTISKDEVKKIYEKSNLTWSVLE